jgi:hypothetical protein
MQYTVNGYAFTLVLDGTDGNVVELQVPALGNGLQPFTVGFDPAVTVAYAESVANTIATLA